MASDLTKSGVVTPEPDVETKTMHEDLSAQSEAESTSEDWSPVADVKADEKVPTDWYVVMWIGFLHAGALTAPFFFTWKGLGLAVFMAWLTGSLGVCLGYHRLLTHRSFDTYRPVRWLFGLFGTLAGEGPPISWVAVHRKHHTFSDQDGDPHSPRDGAWWSHMLWLVPRPEKKKWKSLRMRYAPDLLKDPVLRFLDKTFLFWHLSMGLAVFLIGTLGWDLYTGISLLVYGMFLRLVYVLHTTWFVNSASHMWGYQNYETKDDSRNLWWVGLLAYGEGWHNNHHAYQRMARHGHRWWELDMTYMVIWLMERFGLAWNIVRNYPKRTG